MNSDIAYTNYIYKIEKVINMSDRIVEVVWELDKTFMDNTEWYVKTTENAKLPQFVSIPDYVSDYDIHYYLYDEFGYYVYDFYFVD